MIPRPEKVSRWFSIGWDNPALLVHTPSTSQLYTDLYRLFTPSGMIFLKRPRHPDHLYMITAYVNLPFPILFQHIGAFKIKLESGAFILIE